MSYFANYLVAMTSRFVLLLIGWALFRGWAKDPAFASAWDLSLRLINGRA